MFPRLISSIVHLTQLSFYTSCDAYRALQFSALQSCFHTLSLNSLQHAIELSRVLISAIGKDPENDFWKCFSVIFSWMLCNTCSPHRSKLVSILFNNRRDTTFVLHLSSFIALTGALLSLALRIERGSISSGLSVKILSSWAWRMIFDSVVIQNLVVALVSSCPLEWILFFDGPFRFLTLVQRSQHFHTRHYLWLNTNFIVSSPSIPLLWHKKEVLLSISFQLWTIASKPFYLFCIALSP